ncbi:twin-arginine translocation pathway signal [Billgrantia montanilacus]|uniref:Twin-arginine translocation pathway signal n=1 Tax=Billgrantia montanilacus TaxID=2282305 RepID=A0A368TTH0_9GAMM|nr:twin-arginine translocation pathway signal [Halomonas montanilacus]RCV87537.1 twin-arginine translocation pathway signal [Halomonas montanilacus]
MNKTNNPQRRRFLKTLGVGTAAAGAAAAGAAAAGAAAAVGHVTLVQAENKAEPVVDTAQGYRETDHIRTFYATLRD